MLVLNNVDISEIQLDIRIFDSRAIVSVYCYSKGYK